MAILIDVSQARFWERYCCAALDKVGERFKAHSIAADVLGMKEANATLTTDLNGSTGLRAI